MDRNLRDLVSKVRGTQINYVSNLSNTVLYKRHKINKTVDFPTQFWNSRAVPGLRSVVVIAVCCDGDQRAVDIFVQRGAWSFGCTEQVSGQGRQIAAGFNEEDETGHDFEDIVTV